MSMLTIRNLAFAGASMLALSTPAFAQDSAAKDSEDNAYGSNDIIVEARRKDESAQDVPLVVNAVTSEAVAKLNLRDFKDIATVVPGLSMANNANGIGTTSSVRGVNYDVNASGNNGTIEYYLNDAPVSAAILFTQMFDIGQIEVLRGPQGTLRGRASPSGSITVTAHRPDMTEIGATLSATANDIGTRNLNASINLPVVSDVLAIRLAGVYDQGEGNRVHSINSTAKPYTDVTAGRISIRATPADFLELNGMYQVTNSNATQFDHMASFSLYSAGAPASAVVIRPEERLSINAAPREISQRYEVFNWQAAVRVAGQKLSYVGHHSNSTYKSFDPSAGDQVNFFKGQSIGQSTRTSSTQESHEIRLQNEERIAGMVDYVVGYFHNTLNPPSLLDRVTPVGLNFGSFGALATTAVTKIGRTGNSVEESYFGNLTLHLGEATELSGGVRHIKYASTADLYISCPNYTDCAPLAAAHEDSKSSHTIYSASAKHRFNDSLMVYASYGTSWRPAINVVGDFSVARSALENSFLILPPETSKSFEIGFKSDWFDKRLQLNATLYQQDFVNFPYRSTSGVYFINYAAAVTNNVVTVTPTPTLFNFVGAVPVLGAGKVDYVGTAELARSMRSISYGVMNRSPRPTHTFGILIFLGELAATSCVTTTCPPASAWATR